ncbi:MAG: DUF3445 domain-containing protein [Gammaproteobacteria bacterium]|nr:DUF3445 domain-containing protein [Gammaproteobacteria bacterium]
MFKPAHYCPYNSGRFEIKAGLSALDKNFGNPQDHHVFQIDERWSEYFQTKQRSREESLEKYYLYRDFRDDTRRAVITLLLNQLNTEYPDLYKTYREKDGTFTLECDLDQSRARFSEDYTLIETIDGSPGALRPYADLFDYICTHLQEDVSLVQLDGKHDVVAALHLCFPNHWSAEEKVGKCFAGAHIPVPHMEKINRGIDTLSRQFLQKGPFVRFAWGIATDGRLNHHPQPPEGTDPVSWKGRQFNPEKPELYVRIERQCLVGIPKVEAYLFMIRTYIENVKMLTSEEIGNLINAIESMSDEVLKYKGLLKSKDAILQYLHDLANRPSAGTTK